MYKRNLYKSLGILVICLGYASCKVPVIPQREAITAVPKMYNDSTVTDTTNMTAVQWRRFFTDPNLVRLIDTALKNNQELLITLQDIEIARNDIQAKHGKL